MTAARDDLAARGVRVKALEWEGSAEGFFMRALSPFGEYQVSVEYGDEWYSDFTGNADGRSIRLSGNQDGPVVPQAAAQADYEARILAALEVTP